MAPLALPAPIDRKSTRLNSSHPSISYAVFCLKKKIEGVGRAVDDCHDEHLLVVELLAAQPEHQAATAERVEQHCHAPSTAKATGCTGGGSSPAAAGRRLRPTHFFFNAPAPPEIYTLSLHDALPI